MDAIKLRVLEAEIQAQLNKIEQVYKILDERADQMQVHAPAYVESVAYQLHNLYNALEDLFKIVAVTFENNISDLMRWHTELLNRMALEIRDVRPALLSAESVALLHELRAFRHFFRHAYGIPLDDARVEKNILKAREVRPLLWRDVASFLEALGLPDET